MNKRILLPFLMLLIFGSAHAQSADESAPAARVEIQMQKVEVAAPSGKTSKKKGKKSESQDDEVEDQELEAFAFRGTEDTGTPGNKNFEVKSGLDCQKNKDSKECVLGMELVYGIGDNIEVGIETEQSRATETTEDGTTTAKSRVSGVTAKWKFLDREGLRMATGVTYSGKPTNSEDEGRTIEVPFVVSYDVKAGQKTPIATVTMGAIRSIDLDHSENTSNGVFVAAGHNFKNGIQGVASVSQEKANSGDRKTTYQAGVAKVILDENAFKSGFFKGSEVKFYTTLGREIARAADGSKGTGNFVKFGFLMSR